MSIKHYIRQFWLASALSGATLLAACGGSGGNSGGTAGANYGNLSVSMTDGPACGFDSVNVTVSKVRVNQSATASDTDSGWQDITLSPAKKIDLLSLRNGILMALGQTTLPAGHYTQIRLVLADNTSTPLANSVVASGSTTEVALDTPSAIQSGIKLNNEFDVAANATADLVLDFDACKSIVSQGNSSRYLLKPVISVTPKATSGSIGGYLPRDLSNAVVTVQQNGVLIKSTVPNPVSVLGAGTSVVPGAFVLSSVPAGTNYTVVITSDAHATTVITGVPVVAGADTLLSTGSGIVPPASAMATVSGTVSPASAQASLRALQTIATGGPTIEVGFKAVDAITGAYTLTLPVGGVSLGAYSALPITFSTTQTLISAGKYTIEASATGYTKQTADVDISGTNAAKDFTLTQ